jgi:phenylacetate-coenzyme A ligase PaaK-like adenylate-forming protein
MMTTMDSSYESLSQRHRDDLTARVPGFLARISWSAGRIRAERQASLRRLLAHAKRKSPWHGRRLAHIDPETFVEADLVRLPKMTKADVMANFDEIVTDPRVSLAAAEKHVAQLEESSRCNSYLFDQFHVIATSGSSGRRGVFVYDWDGWTVAAMCVVRNRAVADREIAEMPADFKAVVIGADNASHLSYALTRTFFPEATLLPVTLPLAEIVVHLNALQPHRIAGYPSMLHQLCLAAERGELHIAPIAITSTAEPLLPEIHAALERSFAAKVFDAWGCSEAAMLGLSCPKGSGLHLFDDLACGATRQLGAVQLRIMFSKGGVSAWSFRRLFYLRKWRVRSSSHVRLDDPAGAGDRRIPSSPDSSWCMHSCECGPCLRP